MVFGIKQRYYSVGSHLTIAMDHQLWLNKMRVTLSVTDIVWELTGGLQIPTLWKEIKSPSKMDVVRRCKSSAPQQKIIYSLFFFHK